MPVGPPGGARERPRADVAGSDLSASRRHRPLRRHRRARRRLVRGRARPDLRPDRPERRRQDHAVQLPEPALPARAAATSCSRAATCWTLPRHRIAALGIGRTFQNLALFRTMTVRDNIMVGGHCRGRGGFFANALRLPLVRARGGAARRARPRDLIDAARSRRGRRRAGRRPALRHAEARRAGARAGRRAKLLLLDEPAGGLNHEEVDELRELHPRDPRPLRPHRAAGRASHEPGDARLRQGRGARFRPQDRRRHAGRGAARPEVIRAYLGSGVMAALLEMRRRSTPATAQTQVLHGSTSRSRRAASPRCSAPTAPARPRRCAPSAA